MKIFLRFTFLLILAVGFWNCQEKNPADREISVNNGERFLSLDGQTRSGILTVNSSSPWSVTADDNNWLTLSATSGTAGTTQVEISLKQNDGESRKTTLTFTSENDLYRFQVSQSALTTGFDTPTYYFYTTFGTMPTLYAGLHLLSHNHRSYVFYERSKTFDPVQFPSYATVFAAEDLTQNATVEDVERMRDIMKGIILEINRLDPTAVFGLYVDDLRCRLGYDWFVAQGIDSSRVKVTMLSDGTGTYNNFYNYFGNEASAQQNWENYAAEVEALDWNHGGRYPITRAILPEFESYTWPYYLATRPGYRLMLQDRSLLETESSFIREQIDLMKIESIQPYQMLAALPKAQQQQFYRMASFDRDHFAALFEQSAKPNLIIIGTNGQADAQRNYVSQVVEKYGDSYDIFFKPHPSDLSSVGYEEEFPGLTLLPGQMPFEIFVWSLIDQIDLIGGYSSTVFLTVPLEKVGFLFAPNAESLARPLNLLFQNVQGIDWIQ